MAEFMNSLTAFFNGTSVWVYFFIFFGKIAEVTVSTLRIVLINRGERGIGSAVAIIEITLWIFITGTVLANFQSDYLKVVVFVLAFSVGNFLGSWLDEKLAFGLCSLQAVVQDSSDAAMLSNVLRENGFGVTVLNARGKGESDRYILSIMLKRKLVKEALTIIHKNCKDTFVTVSDVKSQKGGYFRNSSTRGRISSLIKQVNSK